MSRSLVRLVRSARPRKGWPAMAASIGPYAVAASEADEQKETKDRER